MLNEIRRLFRQSMEAFRLELETREPEDQVAELLTSMRKELVAAKAAIPEFEAQILRVRAELRREEEALEQCRRRATMAERIGDGETVRVANDFAERHTQRIAVLQKRLAAAEADLDLHRREAQEMTQRYKHADANRFALLAQLRRAGAMGRRNGGAVDGDVFSEFSRMEERLERDAAVVDALDELDDSRTPPPNQPPPAEAVEDRLRELKRRMGRAE